MTKKGRLVTLRELDDTVSQIDKIDLYKLIQTGDGEYEIIVVTPLVEKTTLKNEVTEILREIYGKDAKISVIFAKDIAPEISGKYLVSRAVFDINLENYIDREKIPGKQIKI